MTTTPAPRFLRLPDVKRMTGLGHDTIYKLERAGDFPRRRKLTPRASAWLEHEVAEWMQSRPVAEGEIEAESA